MADFRERIRQLAEVAAGNPTVDVIELGILRAITELLEREPSEGMQRRLQARAGESDIDLQIAVGDAAELFRTAANQLLREVKE